MNGTKVVAFEYPASGDSPSGAGWAGWAGWEESDDEEARAPSPAAGDESALRAEFERRLGEEARRAFEAGRERGRLEGRQAEQEAQLGIEQRRKAQVAAQIERIGAERDRYFERVEREVVELALAIAARILRREAQMDPLLLTGAVRVALGQLAATTQVRLRVPAAELALWSEAMALLPNLPMRPAVEAGEKMTPGDCLLETELGTLDLGVRAQLAEIERGFFDQPRREHTFGQSEPAGRAARAMPA